MRITNREIAQLFENIADLLQIKGESIHRVLAYRNGSEAVRDLPRDLNAIHEEGNLTEIPGIGKTLAEKIEEILTTGKLEFYERLSKEVPPSLLDVLHVNGVGPKKAKLFWKELNIITLEALEKAARAGELRGLSGMGAKSEQKIIEGIEALARRTDRISIGAALPAAQMILDDLLSISEVLKGDLAGSLRRWRPTIGDIDILIASEKPEPIMERFVHRENVARILGHGPTKSSVELLDGLQVDVRVLVPERYGTALAYFTGSQAHNIRMRELALRQDLTLNEHAFTRTDGSGEEILCATEEEVYETLGLPWIPPELREDRGEIEAAQEGKLSALIEMSDIRSDLHMHTTWSDGKLSVLEMAQIAQSRGLSHIVITDHSRSLGVANGLSIERLREQREEIRAADAAMGDDFRVLHGTEMEIRNDGTLDFPDEVLAELDVVIASLHTGLRQPREQVTERLINAISNPHVDIIAHPRGQLIPEREPADLDMDAVFEAAKQHDVALEINSNPARLDLDAIHARHAAELGIKITINTDSHAGEHFELLSYGIGTARRAWITANQVINTWS
ncbi:MAG TPA: DNA polymerase/3'-5' exonuclease PolX, partial [Aggregatilineales bacterium]|nr:DNA polymerase/3'-5' exonuclease PolX [Aggregatilineales bacterium]